ncbi:hypothetical protein QBC43DRAFT_310437 [Cladorrhinum sp. PSN259]|nr:hypothetical protein QBC43DRAFT_310437 [Cladorrhinum sp. PSN259]
MSGVEAMGLILGLYPIVLDLTKTYTATRANGLSSLRRSLTVLEALYLQTCTGLLQSALPPREVRSLLHTGGPGNKDQSGSLWKDPTLHKRLETRLGPEKLSAALELLNEIRSSLDQVKTELTNMSCPNDATFDRVRATFKMTLANMPGSTIRERIKHLKDLNNELRDLLDDKAFMVPFQKHQRLQSVAAAQSVSPPTAGGPKDLFDVVKHNYTCDCTTGHMIGVGCYCFSCAAPTATRVDFHLTNNSWDLCLACPPNPGVKATSPTTAAILLNCIFNCKNNDQVSTIKDICSLTRDASTGTTSTDPRGLVFGTPTNNKTYRMQLNKLEPASSDTSRILFFPDLIQRSTTISPKDRFELALRLSLALVQLCQTPWVTKSWSSADVCILSYNKNLLEERLIPYKFPTVYILHEISSRNTTSSSIIKSPLSQQIQRPIDLFDDEPILTKLGIALIELAFGRSLKDIQLDCFPPGIPAIHDEDLANMCIARTLLDRGLVRNYATAAYEQAVSVCIKRQYIDWEGVPRSLLSGHESFVSGFYDAVLGPLAEVCKRY